jgi:hypothetical protein
MGGGMMGMMGGGGPGMGMMPSGGGMGMMGAGMGMGAGHGMRGYGGGSGSAGMGGGMMGGQMMGGMGMGGEGMMGGGGATGMAGSGMRNSGNIPRGPRANMGTISHPVLLRWDLSGWVNAISTTTALTEHRSPTCVLRLPNPLVFQPTQPLRTFRCNFISLLCTLSLTCRI